MGNPELWDYKPERDLPLEFRDPYEIAVEAVEHTLHSFLRYVGDDAIYPSTLRDEYAAIVASLSDPDDESELVGALVAKADWTTKRARDVFRLSQEYGTSILRNALALAEAMGVEDGESGM